MFIQGNDGYSGNYASSALRNIIFPNARKAGITKVILTDNRIYKLSNQTVELFGTPSGSEQQELFQFIYGNANPHTYSDLVNVVKGWLKDYIAEDIFYGVMLKDEPNWPYVSQTAMTYKVCKDAFVLAKNELENYNITVKARDIYVQVNLLPYYAEKSWFIDTSLPENAEITKENAYREYLSNYLTISGADTLVMDSYPLKNVSEVVNYYVTNEHFKGVQILAEGASKTGASIGGVVLTCKIKRANGTYAFVAEDLADMYFQINSYMAFGADSFGSHTYWAKTSSAEAHPDGTSYINRDGTKGPMYSVMTQIHNEIQVLAPIISKYRYEKCTAIGSGLDGYVDVSSTTLDGVAVSVSSGNAIATQLSTQNGRKAYAVMNVNPPFETTYSTKGNDELTTTLDFSGSGYTRAKIYYCGTVNDVQLNSGSYSITLPAGYAVYVMPY